mmetsp:Transcript_20962/g.60532  ORF Transcript_20962/g.60532 Transcript_20962/m.60532 type:complete len:223 (-) Transcript_20962:531-1199(-)
MRFCELFANSVSSSASTPARSAAATARSSSSGDELAKMATNARPRSTTDFAYSICPMSTSTRSAWAMTPCNWRMLSVVGVSRTIARSWQSRPMTPILWLDMVCPAGPSAVCKDTKAVEPARLATRSAMAFSATASLIETVARQPVRLRITSKRSWSTLLSTVAGESVPPSTKHPSNARNLEATSSKREASRRNRASMSDAKAPLPSAPTRAATSSMLLSSLS